MDTESLKEWFKEEKRDFPWRKNPSPYAVWISEVMLQQTQASVVISFFERWMKRFPTIEALAKAHEEEIMKLWEGLGYYSRARNLHRAAKYLLEHHKGELPQSYEQLIEVKGIGPYTAGAILSFAFHQKAPAVDGNVARVVARLFCVEDDICAPSTQKKLRELTFSILPSDEPWVMMEGLIELGATVCKKNPDCEKCPLQLTCEGYRSGKAERLPNRGKKINVELLTRLVAVICNKGYYLVQKRKEGKVMGGLYEFPYFEGKEMELKFLEEKFGFPLTLTRKLKEVQHTFTRFKAHLFPILLDTNYRNQLHDHEWLPKEKLRDLPFSSGHRRILKQIMDL